MEKKKAATISDVKKRCSFQMVYVHGVKGDKMKLLD